MVARSLANVSLFAEQLSLVAELSLNAVLSFVVRQRTRRKESGQESTSCGLRDSRRITDTIARAYGLTARIRKLGLELSKR